MYEVSVWCAFFFIYCFFGWCFESSYVSLCERKPVNRGFLKGPMLPIYGFGALIMLYVTIPFRNDYVKMYFAGAISATLLEYFTGAAMEKMFKVKYWDYSTKKLNIKGYICLSSTIAWGFFTIFLVKIIHNPIEKTVRALPQAALYSAVCVIGAAMIYDLATSFKTAFSMRDLIVKINEYREKTREEIKDAVKNLDGIKPEISKLMHGGAREILYAAENLSKHMSSPVFMHERYGNLKAKIEALRERASANMESISQKATKDKLRMLRRNPTKTNKWLAEEFEKLKKAEKRHEHKKVLK